VSPAHLFHGPDLRDHLEGLRQAAVQSVQDADDDFLLSVDDEAWLEQLLQQYAVEEVTLRPEDARWEASSEIARTPYGAQGSATYTLPFDGHYELFTYQPNLYGPAHPIAEFAHPPTALMFTETFALSQPPDFNSVSNQVASRIVVLLNAANSQVKQHNESLEQELRGRILTERSRVVEARAALQALTIPVRERADAPKTYSLPGVERRPAPRLPPPAPSGEAKPLEPALVKDFYEHVIDVTRSTGKAMERLHGTFATGSEPQKRDVLLVMLNSHYKGAAAGEVFDGVGKADIVLRFADHNVLVAECKIWNGLKSYTDALEQLEGYLTLRDTRAALIFFVRGKDVEKPVREAEAHLASIPGAERLSASTEHTDFRYRLPSTRFADREVVLHTLFFHVPAAIPPRS
jgi:hypothetical protein